MAATMSITRLLTSTNDSYAEVLSSTEPQITRPEDVHPPAWKPGGLVLRREVCDEVDHHKPTLGYMVLRFLPSSIEPCSLAQVCDHFFTISSCKFCKQFCFAIQPRPSGGDVVLRSNMLCHQSLQASGLHFLSIQGYFAGFARVLGALKKYVH